MKDSRRGSEWAVAAGVGASVRRARGLRGVREVLRQQPSPEVEQRPPRSPRRDQRRRPPERRPCLVGAVPYAVQRGRVGKLPAFTSGRAPLVVAVGQRLGRAQRVLGLFPALLGVQAPLHQEEARWSAAGAVTGWSRAAASAQQARERSRHTAVWSGSSPAVVPLPDMAVCATLPSPSTPSSYEWWPHLSTNPPAGPRGG